jgi:hypothetical protein
MKMAQWPQTDRPSRGVSIAEQSLRAQADLRSSIDMLLLRENNLDSIYQSQEEHSALL